jgi:hypothetical protein
VDKAKDKSIKKDIPFALHRGTIGQVTTALDAAQDALTCSASLCLSCFHSLSA